MTLSRIAGLVFLAWEAWWAYVFVSTPRPDEEMITVAALFLGLILPGALFLLVGLFLLLRRALGRSRSN